MYPDSQDPWQLKIDTVAVLAVLPRYWGRNTRDYCGDGDQSCGTTATVGLSFSAFLSRTWKLVECTCKAVCTLSAC